MLRRKVVFGVLGLISAVAAAAAFGLRLISSPKKRSDALPIPSDLVKQVFSIGFQWQTLDPFLFCVHHLDFYPEGNEKFAPKSSLLEGRNIGQDFEVKDGFRMYHGKEVPGFPVHPHRGFETITLVRKGFVDHADSLGAAGRYSAGDVQWMTAGSGVQHSEMFPLLNSDQDNTLELFQIWINLPAKNKMVPADYKMLWSEQVPKVTLDEGKVQVEVIAGTFGETEPVAPPENSWASDANNEVAVWVIDVLAGGRLTLPRTAIDLNRILYFYDGQEVLLNKDKIAAKQGVALNSMLECEIFCTSPARFLLLQGRPIGEPVVQHGPFVMNNKSEITKAIQDYQSTQFGGWPWEVSDVVHGSEKKRFGRHSDGREEFPG